MSISKIAVAIVGFSLAVPHLSAQTETKPKSSITDRTVTLQSERAAKAARENAAKEQEAANPGKPQGSITDRTVTLKQQEKSNSSKQGQTKANPSKKPLSADITDRTVTLKKKPASKPGDASKSKPASRFTAPQRRR